MQSFASVFPNTRSRQRIAVTAVRLEREDEGWDNPSHQDLAQTLWQKARRSAGPAWKHSWVESFCRQCCGKERRAVRWVRKLFGRMRSRTWLHHAINISAGTEASDNGSPPLCQDMPHLRQAGQGQFGATPFKRGGLWCLGKRACRVSIDCAVPSIQSDSFLFQGSVRPWNQPRLNGKLDKRGKESRSTRHRQDKGIYNGLGGG